MFQKMKQNPNITYQTISDGTENFVNTLFEGENMEKILQRMIIESKQQDNFGWLPSSRLDEDDIIYETPSVISNIVQRYLKQDNLQKKNNYVANMAVSKNNGQNHYCAFWINKLTRKVHVWDSATSANQDSAFTNLFKKSAYLLFKHPTKSTKWADIIHKSPSTTDRFSFQHGGGYLGEPRSLLSQNIFCHTWTLFFLELRLNGETPLKIGCTRGSHPLLPLMIIKLYAQCLLVRMGKQMSEKYIGLKYVWDNEHNVAITLPSLIPRQNGPGMFCGKRVVETALKSKYYIPPLMCKNILYV